MEFRAAVREFLKTWKNEASASSVGIELSGGMAFSPMLSLLLVGMDPA